MLHGGIRYLEHGQFGLVRESLAERGALAHMAPSLARSRRFLVPFRRGDRRPGWMVRLGLGLYDALAGRANPEPHAALDARGVRAIEPDLAADGLTGGALYSDVVMDDARLAVAVAMDAAAHGASIHTHTEVTGARPLESGGVELRVRDAVEGGERPVAARIVVNATGAWADAVRARMLAALTPGRPDPAPLLRPTRGVHLYFPALTRGHGITSFGPDGRVVFVVPFGDVSIVGTTEVEVAAGDAPEAWRASAEEVRYLRGVVARLLPASAAMPALAITAGLRPLVTSDGGVNAATREHRIAEDGDLLTIGGGKYTGFRVMARDLMGTIWDRLARPRGGWRDSTDPLPAWPVALDGPDALAGFAVERAFARRLDDVIRRRTMLWLEPDGGRIAAPVLAEALARRLGWSAERTRDERHAFYARLDEDERLMRDLAEGA
jgi:glycerol-3-phosphate dehydrogenase